MLKFLCHLLALATLASTSLAQDFWLMNNKEALEDYMVHCLVIFFAPPQEVILFLFYCIFVYGVDPRVYIGKLVECCPSLVYGLLDDLGL
jgi:hypothetical protein